MRPPGNDVYFFSSLYFLLFYDFCNIETIHQQKRNGCDAYNIRIIPGDCLFKLLIGIFVNLAVNNSNVVICPLFYSTGKVKQTQWRCLPSFTDDILCLGGRDDVFGRRVYEQYFHVT